MSAGSEYLHHAERHEPEAHLSAKLTFLSDEWTRRLRELLETFTRERAEDLAGERWTVCEVFTNCPPDGRTVGHWFLLDDGRLEYGDGERDADFRLDADYGVALPITRERMRSAEFPALVQAAQATGHFRPGTAVAPRPVRRMLADVHDAIARETA